MNKHILSCFVCFERCACANKTILNLRICDLRFRNGNSSTFFVKCLLDFVFSEAQRQPYCIVLIVTTTVTGTRSSVLQSCFIAFAWRQPRLTSSSEAKDVCAIVVHSGQNNPVSSCTQLHSSGLGIHGETSSICPHIRPPWYAARKIWWCNAAWIGASLPIDRPFFLNNCFLLV